MNIGLIQLDGKLINIALEKIKMYHELQGHKVDYISPIESGSYGKVYCSSIFDFTDKSYVKKDWICGGTGFDLTTKLPIDIENMKILESRTQENKRRVNMAKNITVYHCIGNDMYCKGKIENCEGKPSKKGGYYWYEDCLKEGNYTLVKRGKENGIKRNGK